MSSPEQNRGGVRSPEAVVMGVVRRPVAYHDVRVKSLLGSFSFARLQMADMVLLLLHETSEFLPRAASYRDFPVAAGAMCVGPGYRFGRVLGYNVKIDDTDLVNIHAEDQVTVKAEDAGFDAISVLAVIGNPQEDHASGRLMPTLMPCGRCRGRLGNSKLIRERSLFVMARPDFTVIQLGNLAAIGEAHANGSHEGLTTFTFPETPQILRPRPPVDEWNPRRTPIVVPEIDSRDYDSTIGAFLTRRYFESQQSA